MAKQSKSRTEQSKVRQELAARFLAALEQKQLPWEKGWGTELPKNPVSGTVYRGVNRLTLGMAAEERGYTDPRWCTYDQAQKQGWQVRRHETAAAHVEYWGCYDYKQGKMIDWKQVKELTNADPEYEKNLSLRCRVFAVFNAAQIDGIPEYVQASGISPEALRVKRDTLLQNMGVGFHEGGDKAFYSPSKDTITLPPEESFHSGYRYMATLLHEAGHATGHESRLNRNFTGGFGSPDYAREELRAEIASAFVAQELRIPGGQSHIQSHAAYIQNWISVLQKDPEELFRAISDAQKIADYLIEKGQFPELLQAEAPQPQFSEAQRKEIEVGKQMELTKEELSLLENPRLTPEQMVLVREGFARGLLVREIAIYAKPELSIQQMKDLMRDLEHGLTPGQPSTYDKPEAAPIQPEPVQDQQSQNTEAQTFSFQLGRNVVSVEADSPKQAVQKVLEQMDKPRPANAPEPAQQAQLKPKLTI